VLQIFAGDPFLSRRAALAALSELRSSDATLEVARPEASAAAVTSALQQGGLFGRVAVFLDLEEAWTGSGQKGDREALYEALEGAREALAGGAEAIVLDPNATPARQKRWQGLGELRLVPTPKYANVQRWVRSELQAAGIKAGGDVADTLAELFGDDLPGILGEIQKLLLVGDVVDAELVRRLAQRPAARSAFDLIDAITAGDAAQALRITRTLQGAGEAPVRVMAALNWNLDLVARCTALALRDPRIGDAAAARELGSSPYPTKRALALAKRLDEVRLAAMVARSVAAERAMKGGRDPQWALESTVLGLADLFAASSRSGGRPIAGNAVRSVH
jgi:DNA polymerase III delta subunit